VDSRATIARTLRPLRRFAGSVQYGEPSYCVSCGRFDGFVTVGLPPGVIDICGECESTYGVPPEMTARPDLDAKVVHS
jgi:hypothetical protein